MVFFGCLDGAADQLLLPGLSFFTILHFSINIMFMIYHIPCSPSPFMHSVGYIKIIQLSQSLPVTSKYLWSVVALLAKVLYEFHQSVNYRLYSQHHTFQLVPRWCRGICTQTNNTVCLVEILITVQGLQKGSRIGKPRKNLACVRRHWSGLNSLADLLLGMRTHALPSLSLLSVC